MPIVYQSPTQPDQVLFGIRDLAADDLSRVRIAVAYATKKGCLRLMSTLETKFSPAAISAIPKLMVTSFDFGHTEPAALKYWMNLDCGEVRIANVHRVSGALKVTSGSTNFHLTGREMEVLALMAEGLNMPEIAARLTISQYTVKFHIENICNKLGGHTRSEALVIAAKHNLV